MDAFFETGAEREILAAVTRGLLASIDGRGLDRGALLAAAGLTEEAIQAPDQRVPIANHARLGQAIRAALPGQNLGLQTGASIFGDPRGALGFVLRRSGDMGTAFRNFAFYLRVVNTSQRLSVFPEQDGARGHLLMVPELAAVAHPAEALFSAWVAIGRHLTGVSWNPARVDFTHEAVGDPREHEEFFRCPVSFRQPSSALLLPAEACALAIAPAPHELSLRLAQAHAQATRDLPGEHAALERLAGVFSEGRVSMEDMYNVAPAPARIALARALQDPPGLARFEAAFLAGFEDLRAFERLLAAR